MKQESEDDLQRSYGGHLSVRLTGREVEAIVAIGHKFGLDLDVTESALDFDYVGRDANRFVVRMLAELAIAAGDAAGEIECHVTGDAGQHWFEFYRIRGRKLYVQRGEIVRSDEEEVLLEAM